MTPGAIVDGELRPTRLTDLNLGSEEFVAPRRETPATTLQWQLPARVNAPERNRARAYHMAYCGMVAYTFLLKAFEYLCPWQDGDGCSLHCPPGGYWGWLLGGRPGYTDASRRVLHRNATTCMCGDEV